MITLFNVLLKRVNLYKVLTLDKLVRHVFP